MAYEDIWHKLVTVKKNEIPYHKIMKYLYNKERKK